MEYNKEWEGYIEPIEFIYLVVGFGVSYLNIKLFRTKKTVILVFIMMVISDNCESFKK